jgi:hypothetical protein
VGTSTFAATEASTSTGTLTALESSPTVAVGNARDGSGTMTVAPTSVIAGSGGNTLNFTYTAATGGLSSGEIDLVVPSGWSSPSTTNTDPGYVTSTCGVAAVSGPTIEVTGVTVSAGDTCTITYGDKTGSGPGAVAASTVGTSTFAATEASTSTGTLTALESSPSVEVVSSGGVGPTPSSPTVTRVYGSDAIATAIAISQADFPKTGSAGAVVLARSDFFSDALAGGPLATELDGPLLTTQGASSSSLLDPRVLSEIERVLPVGKTVYVLGGDLALSPGIDSTLESVGYKVVREAGADEWATAVDIAEQMGNPTTIFESTGLSFYDSMSAVPAAIESRGAILLTDGTAQAPETATYLAAHTSDRRYAIGGPLTAAGADPGAIAVYGQDFYGTAAAVAKYFFPRPTSFGAATSMTFTDALSAGPELGSADAPMLLVPPLGPLPSVISQYLSSVANALKGGTVYGGPLAVGNDVLGELDALIQGTSSAV